MDERGDPGGAGRPPATHNELSGSSAHSMQAQRFSGDVHWNTGGVHFHGRPRGQRRWVAWWGAGLVVLVIAGAVIWLRGTESASDPLTVRVSQVARCPGGSWVLPGGTDPAALPPPMEFNGAAAYRAGGATASGGPVELAVHGRSAEGSVVLQDLRVRVLSREPAPADAVVVTTCAGAGSLFRRYFTADLDEPQPTLSAAEGDEATPGDGLDDELEFPFQVSATDPEVFWVMTTTRECACRWQLELDWAAPEGSGTKVIDMSGTPFRTTAVDGLPVHRHLPS